MFPLRSSHDLTRFPRATTGLVLGWLGADLVSRVWPGSRTELLPQFAFIPAHPSLRALGALVLHSHLFALAVSVLFAWVFTPVLFERRPVWTWFVGLSGALLALSLFALVHPTSEVPVLAPEAFLGALLGAFLFRDIWGSVSTLVLGLGWLRILEVPSYVLFFFWLFYLFLGNLFLRAPFADAPMLYFIPLIATLWGFGLESIRNGFGRFSSRDRVPRPRA